MTILRRIEKSMFQVMCGVMLILQIKKRNTGELVNGLVGYGLGVCDVTSDGHSGTVVASLLF